MERQSTRKLFKLVIALVALFTLALSVFAFGACGGEEHKHVYESSGKTAATCGTIGVETFTCSCGDTYVAVTPATGSHKWGADGYCETCGLPNFGADVTIPAFPTIPDGFTAEDLAAIQKAITDSQKGITDAQQAAHDALGQKIDGLDTHPVHKFEKEGAVKTLTMSGSCTTYGVKFTLSTCDVCGATFLTGIEKDGKLGHTSDGGKVAVEPTCQQFGSWQETCTVCGEVINERTLNTVPHDHSVKSAQSVEPGCVTDGLYVYECKWCHEIQPQYNEVKKANPGHHTMPETAKPEDCTVEGGTVTYECTVCGEETTENFEKKSAHEWVYSDVEMTLCGESATVTRSCKNCKVVQENVTVTKDMTDVVTALGDKWSTAHPERTTEESKVVYVPYKDKAGNLLNNWTKFKADNGLTDDADPANLKEDSEGYNAENNVVKYTYYECATCGQPIKVASEAETHNFRVDTTKADWAGHKLDTDGNPIAECVDYTAHWKCIDSSCKDLDITYDQLVKGEGHKWANGAIDWTEETVVAKGGLATGWAFKKDADGNDMVATCTEVGKAFRYCTVCNVDEDNNYDSTKTCGYEEHDVSMVDHVIDRDADTYEYHAPTCTEAGYEEGPCLNCKQATVRNEFEKTEHEWSDWERVYGTEGAAPCQSIVERKTCSNCGATEDREIKSKFEHQGVREWKVNTYPTCTTSGNVVYICDECGETWNEDVPALGHKKAENPHVVDPTCTQNGWSEEYCERCGEAIGERTILPATGHTVAGQRVGIMNAFGVIVWNYGDTRAEFDKLIKDYVDCRDYLYTRDFCKDCDWVSDVIYQIPLLDHDFQWRTDWDELTPEQQLQAAEKGDFYELYIITPATCEDYGAYGYKCENCGEVVFQGYYGPRGHWYYTVSRSEAEGMSADELEKNLNVVGGNESSCLAPGSVTVECVYCGVRYAYGTSTDPETMGHSWKLIEATDNNNILCGDYLSSKTLAYCEKCGLVAELTGTTLPADNYASYLGKEDLTETQLEALKDLLDENDNLNVNKKDVVKPVETDTPEATDEPAETPTTEYYDTDGLIGLIVEAFKDTTKIQMHKFDGAKLYLQKGNCEAPAAYIVLCSICGKAEGEEATFADIKLDKNMTVGDGTESYWDYVVEATQRKAQYYEDVLGYTLIDKNEKFTVQLTGDEEAKEHTYQEIYFALMKDYVKANGGDEATVTKVRYYTGFNFSGFTYAEQGHDWLTNNKECELDPILQFILEDYVGNTTGAEQTYGIILKGAKNHSVGIQNGNYFNRNTGAPRTVAARLHEFVSTNAISADKEAQILKDYPEFANPIPESYKAVVDYLIAHKPGSDTTALQTLATKGVSNWCKNTTADPACPLASTTVGFLATADHDYIYNVYVDKHTNNDFFTLDDKVVAFKIGTEDLPKTFTAENIATFANDLRFVQWLINNPEAAAANANTKDYLTTYADILDQTVLTNTQPTCIVVKKCSRNCGLEATQGRHQYSMTDPVYGINCQHGATCTACGEYIGGEGNHRLVDVTNEVFQADEKFMTALKALLTEAAKTTKSTDLLYPFKDLDMNSFVEHGAVDPTCWAAGKGASKSTLTICVGCLEAWYKDFSENLTGDSATWKTGKWDKDTEQNYTLETTTPTDPQAIAHTFVLNEQNVVTLAKMFKGVEGATFLNGVDLDDEELDTAALLDSVKEFVESINFTFTAGQAMPAGTVTKTLDDDGYLVLHYEQASDGKICQGTAWDEDLCWACAIHWAIENKGAAVSVNDTSKAVGVRTTADTQSTNHNNTPVEGKYNSKGEALLHVYAPKQGEDPWVNEDGETMITVVCLRCDKWDVTGIDGLLKEWIDGDVKEGSFYFVQDKSELEESGRLHDDIADADTLATNFDTKAQPYEGDYHYAATEEATKEALTEAVTTGGTVEVAEGVKADISAEGKNATLTVQEDTEIKLGEGATLTLDITEGKTSDGGNATALIVDEGKSLKIEGGVFDVKIGEAVPGKLSASAIGAGGVGSVLEFVNTVVKANGSIQAENGAKIVVDNSTIIASGGMTVSTNHTLASPDVTYEFTDSKIISYGGAGVGLLVNNETVSVTATGSLFYGTLTGAWIRSAGTATFTDCTFVTGNAVTTNDTWGTGTLCPKAAKAALLVGDGKGSYGSVKSVTLTDCDAVISYEYFAGRNAERQDTSITSEDESLVKFNDETNEFTYEAYTGEEAVGGKTFVAATVGEQTVNVTFAGTSLTGFGLTKDSFVKETNVFFVSGASEENIVIMLGEEKATFQNANP